MKRATGDDYLHGALPQWRTRALAEDGFASVLLPVVFGADPGENTVLRRSKLAGVRLPVTD